MTAISPENVARMAEKLRAWDHCWPARWLETAVPDAADMLEALAARIADLERQLAEARAVIRQIRQAALPVYGDKTDAKTVETIARLADDYLKGTP